MTQREIFMEASKRMGLTEEEAQAKAKWADGIAGSLDSHREMVLPEGETTEDLIQDTMKWLKMMERVPPPLAKALVVAIKTELELTCQRN